jgi:hypothetical protein
VLLADSCCFLQVDMALRDMQERKAVSVQSSMSEEDAVGAGAAQASLDLRDTMSEGLRLRSEMQRAVQEERCAVLFETRFQFLFAWRFLGLWFKLQMRVRWMVWQAQHRRSTGAGEASSPLHTEGGLQLLTWFEYASCHN